MDTYIDFCKICENETDLINGICLECAEQRNLDNQEQKATGN